jgi:hypothetical protein
MTSEHHVRLVGVLALCNDRRHSAMSDKETLIAMLDRAGIEHKPTLRLDHAWDPHELYVGSGYMGFYTVFVFNEDGSLKEMGAYE